jgi:hypothetical protein
MTSIEIKLAQLEVLMNKKINALKQSIDIIKGKVNNKAMDHDFKRIINNAEELVTLAKLVNNNISISNHNFNEIAKALEALGLEKGLHLKSLSRMTIKRTMKQEKSTKKSKNPKHGNPMFGNPKYGRK